MINVVAERIRLARKEAGLTRKELCVLLNDGTKEYHIRDLESAIATKRTLELLPKIASVTNRPLSWFFGLSPNLSSGRRLAHKIKHLADKLVSEFGD